MSKWRCTECSYIHRGSEPPDFCPVCGVGRDKFVLRGVGEQKKEAGDEPATLEDV